MQWILQLVMQYGLWQTLKRAHSDYPELLTQLVGIGIGLGSFGCGAGRLLGLMLFFQLPQNQVCHVQQLLQIAAVSYTNNDNVPTVCAQCYVSIEISIKFCWTD